MSWMRKRHRLDRFAEFGRIPVLLVVAALSGLLVSTSKASAGDVAAIGPAGPPAVADPLTGAIANSSTTWATVAVGKSDGQFDLFWQLFSLDATGRVRLVTPPGVASNGGVMEAQGGTGSTVLAGFGVSQDLTFSPLALSRDGGKSWNPGGLSQPLIDVPSSLGLGTNGEAVALVGGNTSSMLRRDGSLTSWKTVVSRQSLGNSSTASLCKPSTMDAVGVAPTGESLVGVTCTEPGQPGIFLAGGSSWRLLRFDVPSSLKEDKFAVLRLGAASALFAAGKGPVISLVAAWQTGLNSSWMLSAPLSLGDPKDLLASGIGPGTTEFVVVKDGTGERAEVIGGPGQKWRSLPRLPKQTATLAVAPSGQINALSVTDAVVSVWRESPDGMGWTKVQVIKVPISLGSSS